MDETIKLAHELLSGAFQRIGYLLGEKPSAPFGVNVHDTRGRHLFTWHKHPHHLLFYLRKPALQAKSTLREKAAAQHSPEHLQKNRRGETIIRLNNDSDAEAMLRWLLPELPL